MKNIVQQMNQRTRLHAFGLVAALSVVCFALTTHAQTITWQENWESPSAQDNWYADFGIWEIGVPTFGPPANSLGWRAHDGTNCAATVLGGNYPAVRTSRLVSSPILVPVVNLNPRLRFWHWWSFSTGDYGKVQVSTNNGVSWVDLSGQYTTTSSGGWSRGWLDLTPYAGQAVVLGLYFTSPGGGASSGWYVDEMAIETGPPTHFELPEDFEGGWGAWKADYIGGQATDWAIWEIGVPTSGPGAAHGGSNCAATVLSGNYPAVRTSRLVSPAFEVPTASLNPRLRFWHWWSFSTGDYGKVQVSTNNGTNWVDLSGQYATTSSGGWSRAWLDLTPYAGQTVVLGLYFTAPGGGTSSGWYVDEMAIEKGLEPGFSLPEGFEGGWGAWKAQYFGGLATDWAIWEIGVPTSGPPTNSLGWRAHTGTNCAATVLSGNYPAVRTSRLISPAFAVPAANLNPRLRFYHWWSFSTGDYGKVQVSTNNGVTWTDFSLQNYTASSGVWTPSPPFDLSPYAGQTVSLGLYFASPGGGTSSGWYVDDIVLLANCLPPMITAQPTSQTVVLGSNACFYVNANGEPPLSYQWRFNGSPITDATNTSYCIPSAQVTDEGYYDAVVMNSCNGGSGVTSVPPAQLTVLVPPTITSQPQHLTVPVGSNVTLTVTASGSPTLRYLWWFNDTQIPGASSASYSLTNAQLSMSGAYRVEVSNAAGTAYITNSLTVVPGCGAFRGDDVGDVGTNFGSFSQSDCVFTVRGSGEDIEETADAFHFVHQPLIGDGQIIARVLSIQGADSRCEAGVMMRESLDAGARHVFLALSANKEVAFRRRLTGNPYSLENPHQGTNSAWLRLMRMGNTFVAHYSTNGLDWEYVWFTTINLPSQLEVGLAVTAHNYELMATGRFDDVSLGGLTPLPGLWLEPGPRIHLGGEPYAYPPMSQFGGLKMLIGGAVGDRFAVLASPVIVGTNVFPGSISQQKLDMRTFTNNLGTVTNFYGVVPFIDTQALTLTNIDRFYRVQKIGP